MTSYADTSFLCALYRLQENSSRAAAFFEKLSGPLEVSSLLLFEFRQSVRLQVRLHRHDTTKGYSSSMGAVMLAEFDSDLQGGLIKVAPVPWHRAHVRAEELSARHTESRGHRAMDILHVAAALIAGASEFLTFDANQKLLAESEGLRVPL